jgi:hypothetical protein
MTKRRVEQNSSLSGETALARFAVEARLIAKGNLIRKPVLRLRSTITRSAQEGKLYAIQCLHSRMF